MRSWSIATVSAVCVLLGCREVSPDTSRTSASLVTLGERLYDAERYDSALTVFRNAAQLGATTTDDADRARALTWVGLVTGRLGDPTRALEEGQEALSIKTRLKLDRELAFSYHSIGLALLDLDRNGEAKASFQKALEAAQRFNDEKFIAKAYGGLGLVNAYVGKLDEARENQNASRIAAHKIGDARLEANALANLAMTDIYEGTAVPAIAKLDSARALYKTAGYSAGEQNALGQLATAYELTGREDIALATLDSSLMLSRRLGLKEQESDLLRLIGGVHLRLGSYREALNTFARADSMMQRGKLDANLGSVMRSEADARFRLGDLPQASKLIAAATTHHSSHGEPLERLDDLLLAAEIAWKKDGRDTALRLISQARVVADTINTRGSRIAVVLAEAHLADLSGDSRAVLKSLDKSNVDLVAGDIGLEWEANALRSRAYFRLGMLDSARATGMRAVAAVELLRGHLASEALRSTYVADRSEVYGDLVLTLVRMGRTAEAFRIADAARSHELIDRLALTRDKNALSQISPRLAEQERLLKRIDELVEQLRASDRPTRKERGPEGVLAAPAVEVDLAKARAEYEAVAARSAQSENGSISIMDGTTVDVKDVRASLTHGEAIIEYLVAEDRLVTFVVTRDTVRVLATNIDAAALVQRVRLLSDLWGHNSREWQIGAPASRELFKTLVQSIISDNALDTIRRLVIIPHGVISEVPFAALIDETTGRFLIADYDLTELPSATAFAALRARKATTRTLHGGIAFAPFNASDQLPATAIEARAFQAASSDRTAILGRNANESALRAALVNSAIVHVATHGVMNVQSPLFSRIEMASSTEGSPENNGRLELYEVLGIRVRSDLVFLSGCETGAGVEWLDDPVRGTGDLTLAQAFLSAGASNVITTLWRIGDKGAARFAGLFYAYLNSRALSQAFSSAQRAMLNDPLYRSPYYWAGYVLAGEGNFRSNPQTGRRASVSLTSASTSTSSLTVRQEP